MFSPPHQITERIWLRAFGTTPKFPFGELQIRSERYMKKVRTKFIYKYITQICYEIS